MARKLGFSLLAGVILLMASLAFAQTPREGTPSEGKSTFANVAVKGLDVSGVPGYIELTNGSGTVFYLWIGSDGLLRISSDVIVGWRASPTVTEWADTSGTVIK